MKARTGEYRPKQTDYDIAEGINRSFAKKDSSKFIKFINGMGLFVDHLENMTDFGETETLPIFRFLRGSVSNHSRHGYVLDVFIPVIIQQNLGRNRYVVEFPDDQAFASIPDHVIWRPTSICTWRLSFPFTCRLLFIMSVQKSVYSLFFHP